MASYIRRFGFDPGEEVLLEIESVNILDLDPPAEIQGVGTGTVICVGEFENGPFAATAGTLSNPAMAKPGVYEVSGGTDFIATAGTFGFSYGGVSSNNPCARARKADSTATAENWNGNGFVQLSGKKFRRLLICRVDTSVGQVEFKRQAFLTSTNPSFTYDLEPGQTLVVTDSGTDRTATFDAAAATVTSGAGTYPNSFVGGETLTLGYDGVPNFTVTFLAGDTSIANTVARINAYAGFTFAAATDSTHFSLTGIQRGNAAQVRVVSGSGSVLTTLGLTAATTFGTGDAQNIDATTFEEIRAVVEADMSASSIKVAKDASGAIRISKTFSTTNDWLSVKSTSTAASALGFVTGVQASNSGRAYVRSSAGSYPTSFVGGESLVLGSGDDPNFTVFFISGDTTQANIIARINAAAGYAMARSISGTVIEFQSKNNGDQMRVVSASAGVFTALGLTATSNSTTVLPVTGTIPAGTVVQDANATNKFVTMQDLTITADPLPGLTASGSGPYAVKVRHALDDGTGVSANAGTLVALERPIDIGSFSVSNPQLVTAALSESAIDAAYSDAIDRTKATSSVAREANLIYSARQSNTVRKKLRANAIEASGAGCFGRMACVRPPLNTAKAVALSRSTAPGVGATADQRVIYCYPGANTFVPLVAKRGLSGGAGFTADGNVDVGFDGFVASICSQLPPEENPGQETQFTAEINGLETGSNVQGFEMSDYVQFKAKGIAALRMDEGVAIIQSGCTSVDPGTFPQLKNIARRRMADFIQDSLARRAKSYGKKLQTFQRRVALANEMRQFLRSLLSPNSPASQRIDGYSVDAKTGNTDRSRGLGLYRLIIKVRTLSSFDSIVIESTIGEQVTFTEQSAQAA
jgi:hypothetical protein